MCTNARTHSNCTNTNIQHKLSNCWNCCFFLLILLSTSDRFLSALHLLRNLLLKISWMVSFSHDIFHETWNNFKHTHTQNNWIVLYFASILILPSVNSWILMKENYYFKYHINKCSLCAKYKYTIIIIVFIL